MYDCTSVSNKDASKEIDLEAGNGETLYPGLSLGENRLRWGLIRKGYGILAARLVLTTIVSAVTVLYTPMTDLLEAVLGSFCFYQFCPLFKHPVNPIILGLFMVSSSLLVGASYANIEVYGGISALIFCGYIVYDTDHSIKRFSYDEYILASVALYLDIPNLFLSILHVLESEKQLVVRAYSLRPELACNYIFDNTR
ncbi:unnamed protein product [Dovyalis caffra]|uniref:Uncharacterized protein n=1 Tax=Dovyalis caffra TaxID=77055 RepID=A0AAV1SUD5_9ROSI|nr:unnamed protein product [Dovyalis caffra]